MKLSIIIPAYNAEPYLKELIECLKPQITKDTEVIIIDDGSAQRVSCSEKGFKVYRQKNQGCSSARNKGLEKAKGEYISFIDADDIVSSNFVARILDKAAEDPDVIEFSWRSLTDKMWNCNVKLNSSKDRQPNPSVCTRVFKRSFIGPVRFNTKKDSTEDEDFSRRIGYLDNEKKINVGIITDYLYFYRDDVPMSKTKRYAAGLMNTKKVMYYYEHVTSNMADLLEEIKKEDETNEVWLMTERCDIPEMKRYCRVIQPRSDWAHIVRGEHNDYIKERKPPIKTQVVIYRKIIPAAGGLNSFISNFVESMSDKYDITIVCKAISEKRYRQLIKKVRVAAELLRNPGQRDKQVSTIEQTVYCDTLIMLSFLDDLPQNVMAKKVVRMCHACKTDSSWKIPKDYDELVYVSKTAMKSHGDTKGTVIHNMITYQDRRPLILISATRIPAPDKGNNEARMMKLAEMLNKADIPFLWLNFSEGELMNPPKGFHNMGLVMDAHEYFPIADYVVQLSDSEAWSYTMLEALTQNIPVICTPFPSAFEMGVEDGVNAHVIPFDMDFDVTRLWDIPVFEYEYDNGKIISQWKKILGSSKGKGNYKPPVERIMKIKAAQTYFDIELQEEIAIDTVMEVREERAYDLKMKGLAYIIGG